MLYNTHCMFRLFCLYVKAARIRDKMYLYIIRSVCFYGTTWPSYCNLGTNVFQLFHFTASCWLVALLYM